MTNETPQTPTQQLVAARRQQYSGAMTYLTLVDKVFFALVIVIVIIMPSRASDEQYYPTLVGWTVAFLAVLVRVVAWLSRSRIDKRLESYIQAREAAAVEAYIANQAAADDIRRQQQNRHHAPTT